MIITLDSDAADEYMHADPGWEPVGEKWYERPSFVVGQPGSDRLRVRIFRHKENQNVIGKAWFGPGTAGPPGHAHGGSIASLLDEVMGAACWFDGHMVVAANLNITYRRKVPLGSIVRFESWVETVQGRKVTPRSRLTDDTGETLYAEGTGLFITLKPEQWGDMARAFLGDKGEKPFQA